jgi:hypothetical protein
MRLSLPSLASGSLVLLGMEAGVVSVFLEPTDYSPMK